MVPEASGRQQRAEVDSVHDATAMDQVLVKLRSSTRVPGSSETAARFKVACTWLATLQAVFS